MFEIGSKLTAGEGRLVKARLKYDLAAFGKTTDCFYLEALAEYIIDLEESLMSETIANQYTLGTIEEMLEKIAAQRELCARMNWPFFAPPACGECGHSYADYVTLGSAGRGHQISCPHCHHSWCD